MVSIQEWFTIIKVGLWWPACKLNQFVLSRADTNTLNTEWEFFWKTKKRSQGITYAWKTEGRKILTTICLCKLPFLLYNGCFYYSKLKKHKLKWIFMSWMPSLQEYETGQLCRQIVRLRFARRTNNLDFNAFKKLRKM